MSACHNALPQIRHIIANPPAEPFRDLPRRPNGYRRTPEYGQWQAETDAWHTTIADRFHNGLDLLVAPNAVCVTFYGQPLEQTRLTRLANGTIRWAGPALAGPRPPLQPGEQLPDYWSPPLELPGPRQNIAKFLEQNSRHGDHYVRWDLDERILQHAQHHDIMPPNDAWRQLRDPIRQLAIRWISAARELIDPAPLALIRQAAGHPTGHNLFLHNLAATAGELIAGLSATNPGAVAWWLHHTTPGHTEREDWRRRLTWQTHHPETKPPPLPAAPRHPGEIITAVRERLAEHPDANWRMLTAQPAKDTTIQLRRHGPEGAALMTRLLADAALPRTKQPTNGQQALPEPTTTGYRQPPLPLKIAILDLLRQPPAGQQPYRPDHTPVDALPPQQVDSFNQAIRRLSVLTIRQFGADHRHRQYNQNNVRHYYRLLCYMGDYAYHHPAAALRCRTWNGLAKASAKWHRDTGIRRAYQDLEQQAEQASIGDECWDAHLSVHRTTEFTAYLLKTPLELLHESQALDHCVHTSRYRELCRSGAGRIFHLQPPGVTPYDPEGQKRYGTTVQLENSPQGWHDSQHQGYRNRAPHETENQWASQLLAAWLNALRDDYRNRNQTPNPRPDASP